ncbi:MAG: PD40 domain-containing protein [Bacteroidales bacterium]|nr:PD40 domain-containing protein [Bacteroidales bacterium]
MAKVNTILLTAVLLFTANLLSGQQRYHTNSNRALNAYISGKRQYDFLYFESAEKYLKDAINYDKEFYEAYALLGELMFKTRRYNESSKYYREAIKIDSLFSKSIFFDLASVELYSGQYDKALSHFKAYLELNPENETNRAFAAKSIGDCAFAVEAIKQPVPFNPVNLGDSINTPNDEYWPSITVDGYMLMFTRQERTPGKSNLRNQEDFYISIQRDGQWSKAFNAGSPLNTPQNEGAQSVTSDGTGIYFTACDRPGGLGRCDIYYSSFDGKKWSQPVNVGAPVNSNYWEAQPSISSNGKMLFFASNRPGGEGGMDLWYSVMTPDGKWGIPKNPGKIINTQYDEMSPFIHFDGKTLYFSSNGNIGMGGHDIFFSVMNDDTTWTPPVNLGYPINTYNDELGLIIDASGAKGYFSTIRDEKRGKDIFCFDLYDEVRPKPVSYFKGTVLDKETGKRLSADYELVNLKNGIVLSSGTTGIDGNFLLCLPAGANYGLNVNKPGYMFYSDNFMLEEIHTVSHPYIKHVILTPIKTGESILLSNVFFDFDSWELKPESIIELKKLYKLLIDNPLITVEIVGYTDSIGTKEYNQTLSEKRAKSVVDFLESMGIMKERLSYRGYGASLPVADNLTAEGRSLNRRTEVRITGDGKK